MNDRLAALRLFTRVARTGSFSAAGRELGLSQPSASRIISELERDVGASLFSRSTRAVTLTEAGADYLARIEPILDAIDEADHAARGTGELRGVLRVAVSSSFAVREVIPKLPDFMAHHPALRVDLLMDDRRQDLVGEGIDIALRFGALAESSATTRLLGVAERVLVASPAYLRQAAQPGSPADLVHHAVILGPSGNAPQLWTFTRDGRAISVRVHGRLTASQNEGAVAAATAGLGIVSTGRLGCRTELDSGALVRVLADWGLSPIEIHAVFPAGRAAKMAARAFADHVAASLRS